MGAPDRPCWPSWGSWPSWCRQPLSGARGGTQQPLGSPPVATPKTAKRPAPTGERCGPLAVRSGRLTLATVGAYQGRLSPGQNNREITSPLSGRWLGLPRASVRARATYLASRQKPFRRSIAHVVALTPPAPRSSSDRVNEEDSRGPPHGRNGQARGAADLSTSRPIQRQVRLRYA